MKKYVAVIQTQSGKFELFFLEANSFEGIYPQTSKLGTCMTIWSHNKENVSYCRKLANKMNNQVT